MSVNKASIFLGQISIPLGIGYKFLLFLGGLMFIYISNNNRVEAYLREISDLEKALKEKRYEYLATESELLNMSKQSEVLRRVEAENLGLKELTEPPRVIKQ